MKTKITLTVNVLIVYLFILESCTTTYHFNADDFFKQQPYQSDKPFTMKTGSLPAPLLSKKGEVNLTMDLTHGFGLQTSAAVSNKVALLVNGSMSTTRDEDVKSTTISGVRITTDLSDDSYIFGYWKVMPGMENPPPSGILGTDTTAFTQLVDYTIQHELSTKSIEAAVGLYSTFDKAGRLETYGGIAYGSAENQYMYSIPYAGVYSYLETRNYFRFFVQENVGYVTNHTEGALIARLSYLHFSKQAFTMEAEYPQYEYEMTAGHLLLQPAIKFGIGGKALRFYMQNEWNVALTHNSDLKWYGSSLHAGVIFRINE